MNATTSEPETDDARQTISFDEAVALLPEGDTVHTFVQAAFGLLGADWPRQKILDALKDAECIDVTGPMAPRMHHGLAIPRKGRGPLFIETRRTGEVKVVQ